MQRGYLGHCILCGWDIYDGETIPGTNYHACDPGIILHQLGPDAYAAWRDKQTGTGMTFKDVVDSVLSSLEKE